MDGTMDVQNWKRTTDVTPKAVQKQMKAHNNSSSNRITKKKDESRKKKSCRQMMCAYITLLIQSLVTDWARTEIRQPFAVLAEWYIDACVMCLGLGECI